MPKIFENASVVKADATSIPVENIPVECAALRETFNSDRTLSKEWRVDQLKALQRLVTEGRDDLCKALNEDLHKSTFEGYLTEVNLIEQEICEALHHLDHWMEDDRVSTNLFNVPAISCVKKDPLGVALILGAWNYPVMLGLHPVVGAIAAGNCVMIKPGSYSQAVSNCISRLIPKYMDTECVKVCEGNRHVTTALLKEKWDMIFFTGSEFVGKKIAEAAASQLCPVVLELGGKSPCIVDSTADLYVASRRISWGAFLNCGQTCVRPDYLLVQEDVADKFIKLLKEATVDFYGQDPSKTEWFGRVINESNTKRLTKAMEDAKPFLVHGGGHDVSQRFVEPTIYDFKKDLKAFEGSIVMSDEIFGPLIPIYRYGKTAEVVNFIRARPKPLGMYCFTTDNDMSKEMLTRTSSGGAIINDVVVHLSNSELPFGGVGSSGMGNYHGKRSFDSFSHHKAVLHRTCVGDVPVRYPPYTDNKKAILFLLTKPWVAAGWAKMMNLNWKNIALVVLVFLLAKSKLS